MKRNVIILVALLVLGAISLVAADVAPVLNVVLDNALRLCEADRAAVLQPDANGNYLPVAGRWAGPEAVQQ